MLLHILDQNLRNSVFTDVVFLPVRESPYSGLVIDLKVYGFYRKKIFFNKVQRKEACKKLHMNRTIFICLESHIVIK